VGLLSFYQGLSGFMYLHANGVKNGVKYQKQEKDEGEKICRQIP